MAYIKNTWVDQEVERPRTYQKEDHADGSFTLIDDFGLVSELGTPVNADNMNHIEEGIGEHEERITALENLPDVYLKTTQITNCITEIPQRIKADVVDGTLNVYAGTVAIVPYGTEDRTSEFPVGSTFIHENFKVVDTQFAGDKFIVWVEVQNNTVVNATWGTNEQVAVYLSIGDGTIGIIGTGRLTSGTTAPTATNRQMWYDTENNIINNYSGGSLIGNNYSFPFIIATSAGDNAIITSIDKTFNGFGYIGSVIWRERDITGLVSNGKNTDGTYNNIEYTPTKLDILNVTSSQFMFADSVGEGLVHYYLPFVYQQDTPPNVTTHCFWHDTLNNQWKFHGANDTVWKDFYPLVLGTGSLTDGKITSFDVKQPFRAVDYSDLGNLYTTTKATTTSSASANRPAVIVQNYVNGKSWYRVWSDGWIEQGGNKLGTASDTVTLPKAFTTTDYTLVANDCFVGSTGSSGAYSIGLAIRSTSKFQIYTSKDGVGVSWYACGY